jgi:hypothetical protein
MLKNNINPRHYVALISVAVVFVIFLGMAASRRTVQVVPSNQVSMPDHPNVMHSDLYWSPLDECSDGGSIDMAECRPAQISSLQSALDGAADGTILRVDSQIKSDQSSADASAVSEKAQVRDINILHYQDKSTPPIMK